MTPEFLTYNPFIKNTLLLAIHNFYSDPNITENANKTLVRDGLVHADEVTDEILETIFIFNSDKFLDFPCDIDNHLCASYDPTKAGEFNMNNFFIKCKNKEHFCQNFKIDYFKNFYIQSIAFYYFNKMLYEDKSPVTPFNVSEQYSDFINKTIEKYKKND